MKIIGKRMLVLVGAMALVLTRAAAGQGVPASTVKGLDPLTRQIHHQLLMLPYYSVFDHLSFTLEGDKVTLSGQVLRPTLRTNAEAAIKSIEGVGSVVNKIEVLPASSTDDDIRRAVYRAVFEDTVLAKYAAQAVPPIHIVVKSGTVTLEGTVDSEADRDLATKRASSVANILQLTNHLERREKAGGK